MTVSAQRLREIEKRNAEVVRRYRACMDQVAVAAEFGLSPSYVSRVIGRAGARVCRSQKARSLHPAVNFAHGGMEWAEPLVAGGQVALVPNARGVAVLISPDDLERVLTKGWSVYFADDRWHCRNVTRVDHERAVIRLHNFIMQPASGRVVDHINGNTLDNRRENLRECTGAENARNTRAIGGMSIFKGVARNNTQASPWRAYISQGGKQQHLGVFATEEEAARAYDAAARRLFGDFAALNFPRAAEQTALRKLRQTSDLLGVAHV